MKLPALPKEVKPIIVTGLEALGRGHDLNKLDALIGGSVKQFGEAALARVKVGAYIERRGLALGVDTEGLIMSDDEFAAQQQMQQRQALIETLGPNAINQLGGLAKARMETTNEQS
jgi:hypothetical protein